MTEPTTSGLDDLDDLLPLIQGLTDEEIADLVETLPLPVAEALMSTSLTLSAVEPTPLDQAVMLDPAYRMRPHLSYLNERLSAAVHDVRQGKSRLLTVSMPPRSGKSVLTSMHFPLWVQRLEPSWKIGMLSHDDSLVNGWASAIRKLIEEYPSLGVRMTRDHGATTQWQLQEGGGLVARSIGASVTGLGFKVLLLDDLVKDFVTAHSPRMRDILWDKWRSDIFTRLEPPYLVVAIGTRWHEDDFIGRLLSPEHEGDPEDWEVIEFPALAEGSDVLGRAPGQPLISPLLEESEEEALARWAEVRTAVGSYTWSALYQQRPAPARGAIFDVGWWRYWTPYESKATEDGRVVHLSPEALARAGWLDSWDCSFKGGSESDYVVAQRWARLGANRYLVHQERARLTFTQTLARMRAWGDSSGPIPYSPHVHERLIEDKANGTAVIDMLKEEIPGLIPVNPTESKEARARAETPGIEAGNVLLPLPSDPGNEWVSDLISELRDFPNAANDDQVDALTQALRRMRSKGTGVVSVPGRRAVTRVIPQDRAAAARSQRRLR